VKKFLFSVLIILASVATVWAITGAPFLSESLHVTTTAVKKITAATYQPFGALKGNLPCLLQTNGAGYYRYDYYTGVTETNYTPDATCYHCKDGDIIVIDHPQWFRMIAVVEFSAFVTSHSR